MNTKPDLLRFTAELRLQEIRAYVASALTPEIAGPIVDAALSEAKLRFPDHIRSELESALRDAARLAVRSATYGIADKLAERLIPVVREALADALSEATARVASEAKP